MLEELVLENVGVIGAARLELSPRLTVITGETGAGKTMVLSGLHLIMGGKSDPGLIRTGAGQAVVEGRWLLKNRPAQISRVADAGGSLDDDGTVVAARVVTASRSRAHLGGRSVPRATLAEFSADLVTVHGQSDQTRMRTASRQRAALDAFAGQEHLAQLSRHSEAWAARAELLGHLAELEADSTQRTHEAETLRSGLAHVARVDPKPNEDRELAQLIARLSNVELLRSAAAQAHGCLVGACNSTHPEVGAHELLAQARGALASASGADPELAALGARMAEVEYQCADLATDLASYLASLEAEPEHLEAAHQRLAQVAGLTRAHGGNVEAVLAWVELAENRLLDLEEQPGRLVALQQQAEELGDEISVLAQEISGTRRRIAVDLAGAITTELVGLAMPDAKVTIAITSAPPGPSGIDHVEFQLAAHVGAPTRPLAKGASGGELSRVMLAIEVALAARHGQDSESGAATAGADNSAPTDLNGRPAPLPTFVFDEVDAGVGGQAAVELGRRLASLATTAQVVVVTHLPQVAAFGDTHLVVTKSLSGQVSNTGVAPVTGEARVRELARMLAGQDTVVARRHAAELLSGSRL